MKTRVLVVDDSVVYRQLLSGVVRSIPGAELIGTAFNGESALRKIRELKPDLVTLDIEMPVMNGLEFQKHLRLEKLDTTVVVVSGMTLAGGILAVQALELGAFEILPKPAGKSAEESFQELSRVLGKIIRNLKRQRELKHHPSPLPSLPRLPEPEEFADKPKTAIPGVKSSSRPDLVLIGTSTGGPITLGQILVPLPRDFRIPIFIVQHMPPLFTQALAESLDRKCQIAVKEAQDGETAKPGFVYIAPGGIHMALERTPMGEIGVKLVDTPPENGCRPSVDVLFRSAASHFPRKSLAIILTGMGNDGFLGVKTLKEQGCCILAQNQASCVVYGMPRVIVDSGLADEVLPPERIAKGILKWN